MKSFSASNTKRYIPPQIAHLRAKSSHGWAGGLPRTALTRIQQCRLDTRTITKDEFRISGMAEFAYGSWYLSR